MKIIVIGAGGHAGVCIDAINKSALGEIVGIIDSIQPIDSVVHGYKIIGRQSDLNNLKRRYGFDAAVIAIGDNYGRKMVFDEIIKQIPNLDFPQVIHPTAVVALTAKLGRGTILFSRAVVQNNCNIGEFCLLNTDAILEHDSVMEDFSTMSVRTATGGYVTLKSFSAVNIGSIVSNKLTIGYNSVVGAGSLLLQSLPDHVLAFGTPAKISRQRKEGEPYMK